MSTRAVLITIGLCLLSGAIAERVSAQRPPARQRGVQTSVDELAVRAEYAGVLLQNGRYDEATREYRELLAIDPGNVRWRIALARALAWGGRGRAAERELQVLDPARRSDPDVMELLRVARAAITDATSAEAQRWVAEDAGWLPYRVALARALAREGQHERALAHLDTVLARDGGAAHLREAAGIASAAGRAGVASRHLASALALSPHDTALRRELARTLASVPAYPEALAHYDTLLGAAPEAGLLFERGQVRAWMGDLAGAERDVATALALRADPDWFAVLGDIRRWRGDWRGSREAYRSSLALAPMHAAATVGLDALAREERAALVVDGATTGWRSRVLWREDNAGFLLLASRIGYGTAVGPASALAMSVEQRRVAHRSHTDVTRWVTGWRAEAEFAHGFSVFDLDLRAGLARHALAGTSPVAHLGVSAWLAPVRVSAAVTREPLYARLLSLRTLVDWADGELRSAEPLDGRTASATATIPVGDAELWLLVERLEISDGNSRRSASVGARYELSPRWTALYSGGHLAFEERSDLYWDPDRYAAHSLGIEHRWQHDAGLSGTLRAMQGLGWSTEALGVSADSVVGFRSHRTPQLALGGSVAWRAAPWAIEARIDYARGRAGGYQSLEGILQIRLAPRDARDVSGPAMTDGGRR